ncbi:MAG: tetratricopeptide repeat protein [Candidatus Wildermuthbacteria bacterium]|nr:tetratricopeptide repeat protein [Candidatus Wildermuthbacteria bacterium]
MPDKLEEAVLLFKEGDLGGALRLAEEVLKDRFRIEENEAARLALRNQGKTEDALAAIDVAIQEAGGGVLLGRLLHDRGTTLQGAKRFQESLEFLGAAFLLRQGSGDFLGASYSRFQMAMCRFVAGGSEAALAQEFKSAAAMLEDLLERLKDSLEVSHEGNLRQNLAFCIQQDGRHGEALELYREVLLFRQQAGDNRGYAMTQSRMAECLLNLGHLREANEVAHRALLYFESIGDLNRIAQVRYTIKKIAETRT